MIDKFKEILLQVEKEADDNFSGVGIVLYSEIKEIPVFPLHNNSFQAENDDLAYSFIEISKVNNPYHDGFHFISSNFELTHTSQYFSPPIISGIEVSRAIVGGRYMAALFGSYIQSIILTGIVTKSNGVVIFENGVEVFSKERK